MPSQMIHFLTTKYYRPEALPLLYIGCVAPDCRDVRELKQKSHLRYLPQEERLAALAEKARGYDMGNDFQFGIILHLYTDFKWDTGPMQYHKDTYKGDTWFKDYRHEINTASVNLYHTLDWAPSVWSEIMKVPPEMYSSENDEFPTEDIKKYLDFSLRYHRDAPSWPESGFYSSEYINRFAIDTAESFRIWLADLK
jgi:hypothetical protein